MGADENNALRAELRKPRRMETHRVGVADRVDTAWSRPAGVTFAAGLWTPAASRERRQVQDYTC